MSIFVSKKQCSSRNAYLLNQVDNWTIYAYWMEIVYPNLNTHIAIDWRNFRLQFFDAPMKTKQHKPKCARICIATFDMKHFRAVISSNSMVRSHQAQAWWVNLRGGTKGRWGISLNNFLRSSCFNIELSLPPRCLSISCIHFASYVDFPHWPLHHFLRFCCCNVRTSSASTTSCMHLVSISEFHPPCAIDSSKNHKQDNVSQFVGQLCELEGPRCLNRWTPGWGTLRVGIGL